MKHCTACCPAPSDERLHALAAWTAERAHRLGLSGYSQPEQVISCAILPALALPHLLGGPPVGPWIEIGPGAGALGLTLAIIAPSCHVTLLDRRERVIAYLDLLITRLGLSNARALLGDARVTIIRPTVGVCLRALAAPRDALRMATHLGGHCIAVWHSPTAGAYDRAPPAFRLAARVLAAVEPPLFATLYTCRDRPQLP